MAPESKLCRHLSLVFYPLSFETCKDNVLKDGGNQRRTASNNKLQAGYPFKGFYVCSQKGLSYKVGLRFMHWLRDRKWVLYVLFPKRVLKIVIKNGPEATNTLTELSYTVGGGLYCPRMKLLDLV